MRKRKQTTKASFTSKTQMVTARCPADIAELMEDAIGIDGTNKTEWLVDAIKLKLGIITKICSKCGEDKPINDFAVDRSKQGNRVAACKTCKSAYDKAINAAKTNKKG
jgi:hypothetical protein